MLGGSTGTAGGRVVTTSGVAAAAGAGAAATAGCGACSSATGASLAGPESRATTTSASSATATSPPPAITKGLRSRCGARVATRDHQRRRHRTVVARIVAPAHILLAGGAGPLDAHDGAADLDLVAVPHAGLAADGGAVLERAVARALVAGAHAPVVEDEVTWWRDTVGVGQDDVVRAATADLRLARLELELASAVVAADDDETGPAGHAQSLTWGMV
jgi:hypothetical protein